MSTLEPVSTNRPSEPVDDPPAEIPSPRELRRLAELIATGQLPFPEDYHAEPACQLVTTVRHFRRQRLVHFIARAIAQDILNERGR